MLDINVKHLDMIQSVVSRLSSIQTTMKGWAITLMTGYITLTADKNIPLFISIITILCVSLLFYLLDGAYLYKEKRFRDLYNEIRINPEKESNFSMDTSSFNLSDKIKTYIKTLFSTFLLLFYSSLTIIFIVLTILTKIPHRL